MKYIGLAIIGIIALIVISLATDYGSMRWERFIAPKKENVRREVFEQTKSYNQGKQQELVQMLHEYNMSKNDDDKLAIMATVRQRFADYDENLLSPELYAFVKKCKY